MQVLTSSLQGFISLSTEIYTKLKIVSLLAKWLHYTQIVQTGITPRFSRTDILCVEFLLETENRFKSGFISQDLERNYISKFVSFSYCCSPFMKNLRQLSTGRQACSRQCLFTSTSFTSASCGKRQWRRPRISFNLWRRQGIAQVTV